MALNFFITAAEVVGGLLSGSLSLLSDALHNLSDGISLIVSYVALRLARRDKTLRLTFGLKRAQILAALLNAAVLIAVCLYLFKEAYGRFLAPQPVGTGVMISVAAVGLPANVAGTLLLREGAKSNLNVRSSYFEAHVEVDDMPVSCTEPLLDAVEERLHDRFGINHATLQLEVNRCTRKGLV